MLQPHGQNRFLTLRHESPAAAFWRAAFAKAPAPKPGHRGCVITRRQLLIGAIGGVLGSLVVPRRSTARQADTAQAGIVPLNNRLSLLTGGGTNVLAFSTPDGLVVVDSGTPELVDALMGSLRQLSGGRVATVFNTHWHPQNTGANEVLRQRHSRRRP
jgi:hypothetical protein